MRRFSVSRNNCRGEIRLEHEPFELRHRQVGVFLPYDLLTDIECGKGKIEREVEPLPVAGLLGLKAGELLGIAYAELDLESCAVKSDDPFRFHPDIGGEVYEGFPSLDRADDYAYIAFQRP